jgi:hypothetical protein
LVNLDAGRSPKDQRWRAGSGASTGRLAGIMVLRWAAQTEQTMNTATPAPTTATGNVQAPEMS